MLLIGRVTDISISPLKKVAAGNYEPHFFCDITIRNDDGQTCVITVSMATDAGIAAYQQQGDQIEQSI